MEDPGYGSGRLIFRAGRDHNPEVHGSNPCPATNASGFTLKKPEAFSISTRFHNVLPVNFWDILDVAIPRTLAKSF